MLRRRQSGFGIIEIILVLILVGAVALTMWKINQAENAETTSEETTSEETLEESPLEAEEDVPNTLDGPNDPPQAQEAAISDDDFTLLFPDGWVLESDTGTAGVQAGRRVAFVKGTQTLELVIGNQFGQGVASDMAWQYELDSTGREATLVSSPSEICTDRFSGFCSGGDDQLDIFVKLSDTADTVPANGHGHIFFINDSSDEETDSKKLNEYRSIINSLVINS